MSLSREKRKLVERLRNVRLRGRESLFLVEGVRGAREFLNATRPVTIRFALVSPRLAELGAGAELMDQLTSVGVRVEELEDEELQALSDTERTQGVLLVAEEPESAWPPPGSCSAPRLLLLDGIQDPGNAGTLIRAARAFGLDGVLALEGTVDPWNPKTVRGGAGASAHIPVARVPWSRAREWLNTREIPLLVAVAEGEDVRGKGPIGGWALVVGNEGAGVRPEILEEAHALLAIPMAPDVDSLNVAMAGAILMFALSPTPEPQGNA